MIPVLIPPHPKLGLMPEKIPPEWRKVAWAKEGCKLVATETPDGLQVTGWCGEDELGREATRALVLKLWPRLENGEPLALQEKVYYVTKYHR